MIICNFGVYINEKGKNLLGKYTNGLASVGESKVRNELARWIKSLEPYALAVGIGEITLFILDKERKVFVLTEMLDYTINMVMTSSSSI